MRTAPLRSLLLPPTLLLLLLGCDDAATKNNATPAPTNTTSGTTSTLGGGTTATTANTAATTGTTASTTAVGTSTTAAATPPSAANLSFATTTKPVSEVIAALDAALTAAGPISVVAKLDHAQNAVGAGETLEPTQVIFFGNPKLGTPLMQKNQLAGLDLPQRMLAYSTSGTTYLVYAPTEYVAQRHDVADVPTLAMISGALAKFAKDTAGADTTPTTTQVIAKGQGIITVESKADMTTTYAKLKSAIEAKAPLKIVFELDHQANAKKAELTLRPTKLIAFGNPTLGTPLMQAGRSIGLDLPQKMLVWEDAEGKVFVSYNDPAFLATRHGIDASLPQLATIATALAGLTEEATKSAE